MVGEGEEVTLEYVQLYRQAREECWSKEEFIQEAARIPGIYVPAFYEPVYREDGTLAEMRLREGSGAPEQVRKRVVENMDGAVSGAAASVRRAMSTARCAPAVRSCWPGTARRPARTRAIRR